jgi:hypothetical protein
VNRGADTFGLQAVLINGINFGMALGPNDTVSYRVSINSYANSTLPVVDVGGPNGTLEFFPSNCTMVVPHTQIRTWQRRFCVFVSLYRHDCDGPRIVVFGAPASRASGRLPSSAHCTHGLHFPAAELLCTLCWLSLTRASVPPCVCVPGRVFDGPWRWQDPHLECDHRRSEEP